MRGGGGDLLDDVHPVRFWLRGRGRRSGGMRRRRRGRGRGRRRRGRGRIVRDSPSVEVVESANHLMCKVILLIHVREVEKIYSGRNEREGAAWLHFIAYFLPYNGAL